MPYIYAATFEFTGTDDLAAVRVLAVLAHALTALLLAVEARRRLGKKWSGVAAGVLYLLAATAFRPQDAQAANFEVFMLPLMTAAMVLGVRRRPGAAGVTLAVRERSRSRPRRPRCRRSCGRLGALRGGRGALLLAAGVCGTDPCCRRDHGFPRLLLLGVHG